MQPHSQTFYDAKRKIWSGPKVKHTFGDQMTLGEIALLMCSRHPEKVIQVMDPTGEELTAAQLIHDSKAVAWNLQRLGLQIGDVVGICATNTTNLAAVMIGAFLCGTPTNALFPDFDKETIETIFKGTTPKIVFADVANYKTVKEAVTSLGLTAVVYVMNGEVPGMHNVKELLAYNGCDIEYERFPCSQLSGNDTAAILCSSGTTGPPKGVLCSHHYLMHRSFFPELPADAVVFAFSTMYWVSGYMMLSVAILNGIKRIITDKPFSPDYCLQLIGKHHITEMIMSPFQLVQLVQNAKPDMRNHLESIRTIMCGGAKVPITASTKMHTIMGDKPRPGLSVAYGTSETSITTFDLGGPGKRRVGSDGKLIPNTEVRIVDEHGKQLGPNEQGMLHIRTGIEWGGYYRNPEATQKSMLKGGWYVSGDIGYFDEDGFLFICSRDSDNFKSNNYQIHPPQIEDVIMQLPGVSEVCVFGVPDIATGHLIACAVVRANNEEGQKLTGIEVEQYVKQKMAAIYHLTGGVHFISELPKTGSGKVQRRAVSDLILKIIKNQ